METLHFTKDAFYQTCFLIRDRLHLNIHPSELKTDMKRAWGEVSERLHNGDWDIRHLASKFVMGPKPVVVYNGVVYVSKTYQTVHESVFEENPHVNKLEAPIGGFEWLLRPLFRRSGIRGFFEPDYDVSLIGYERMQDDLNSLKDHIQKNNLLTIHKASYAV